MFLARPRCHVREINTIIQEGGNHDVNKHKAKPCRTNSDQTSNFMWVFAAAAWREGEGVTDGEPTLLPTLAKPKEICTLFNAVSGFPVFDTHPRFILFSVHFFFLFVQLKKNKKKNKNKWTNVQTVHVSRPTFSNTWWFTFRNIHVEWKMKQ